MSIKDKVRLIIEVYKILSLNECLQSQIMAEREKQIILKEEL